jgi:uncharacterized protein (TIGR02145 family)
MLKYIIMKKVFWIKPTIFAVILLLFACKKEEFPGDVEYKITHWPEVKTLDVTNLTSTTATLNGTVNGHGLSTMLTFEYDTATTTLDIPTIYSNTIVASQSPVTESGIINVSADISGLTPYRIYHFRIKAENSLWKNFYGSDQYFLNGIVLDFDGNEYKAIQIGTQVWMAENLRTTRYADGKAIPLVTNNWNSLTSTDQAYCWYADDSATYASTYGALYNWAAAMKGDSSSSSSPSGVQGVCPDGWHLPSLEEWRTLQDYLGGEDVAGDKLRETDTIHWHSPNAGATNESGFTALPGGMRNWGHTCQGIGDYGFWWSSTLCTRPDIGIYHFIPVPWAFVINEIPEVFLWYNNMSHGESVRCVKDPGHN